MAEPKVLAVVPLIEGRSEIRILAQAYKGKEYVNIRKFVFTDAGTWVATANGLTVAPAILADLLPPLKKVANE